MDSNGLLELERIFRFGKVWIVGIDRYGSSRYRYQYMFLADISADADADTDTDTDIFGETYRSHIPIPIFFQIQYLADNR